MQILLGLIVGAVIGLIVHFSLPHRETRGVALAPVAGAAASGVMWAALTWQGMGIQDPVIWLIAVIAPAVTTLVLALVLTRVRRAHDAKERARLGV